MVEVRLSQRLAVIELRLSSSVGQQRHFLAKLLRHFSPFSPFPHIQYAINNIQYAIAELIFLYQGWYLMGGGFCLKLYSAIELLVL